MTWSAQCKYRRLRRRDVAAEDPWHPISLLSMLVATWDRWIASNHSYEERERPHEMMVELAGSSMRTQCWMRRAWSFGSGSMRGIGRH